MKRISSLILQDFPIPEIHDDDALLKVEMVGVCGSDPGYYSGKTAHAMPLIMGHEIVGRIDKIGSKKAETSGLKVGDRVIVENRFGCGVCKQCVTGHYSNCVFFLQRSDKLIMLPSAAAFGMVYGVTSTGWASISRAAFPRERSGDIYAVGMALAQISTSLSLTLRGILFDRLGSCIPALWCNIIFLLIGIIGIPAIGLLCRRDENLYE